MKTFELALYFKDLKWMAQNKEVSFESSELQELDGQIKKYLHQKNIKGQIKVSYYFDFDNFPRWMRQYMPHYFNRQLIFTL